MLYSLHQIITQVRVLLNYSPESRPLIDVRDEPTLSINRIIATMLPMAAEQVLLTAPLAAIDTLRPLSGKLCWKSLPMASRLQIPMNTKSQQCMAFLPLPDYFRTKLGDLRSNINKEINLNREKDNHRNDEQHTA